MSNFTPGPWEVGKAQKADARSWFVVIFSPINTGKYHTPRAAEALGVDKEEAEANGQLIGAAPDLLHACKDALQWMHDSRVEQPLSAGDMHALPVAMSLEAAINKAEDHKR